MRHVVNFSGGAGSWMAAKRVAERYGTEELTLLTADTGNEAPDWHEFIQQAATDVGGELVIVRNPDYKDIWELAHAKRMMPSLWHGFCTIDMKIKPIEQWMDENCDPADTIRYFGYDWTEDHRLARSHEHMAKDGWLQVEAPLIWEPLLSKQQILDALAETDLPYPEAYTLGISHNNCLATGCFKQGEAAWHQLLRVKPEVYKYQEEKEQEFIQYLQDNPRTKHAGDTSNIGLIFRRRRGMQGEVLTLQELRKRIEAQGELFTESDDWGACGCVEF